jgi:hypothetical protein
MAGYGGKGSQTGKYGHVQFGFTHNGRNNYQLFFMADETIECYPPMVKGEKQAVWTCRNVDVNKIDSVRQAAGMKVGVYDDNY